MIVEGALLGIHAVHRAADVPQVYRLNRIIINLAIRVHAASRTGLDAGLDFHRCHFLFQDFYQRFSRRGLRSHHYPL
jgi:hypothetical protein